MIQLKVQSFGKALGLPLPQEVLEALALQEGDDVILSPSEKGFVLSSQSFKTQQQLQAGEEALKNFPNALRELAK